MNTTNQALIISFAFLSGFAANSFISSPSKKTIREDPLKAIRIIDGDSLVIDNVWQTKIRLNAIDTPERGHIFAKQATLKLEVFCLHKNIILKNKADGAFGRISADIYCDGVFINPKMIEAGLAIVSIQHAKDASLYALQDKARQNCRGIWSQDITKIYNEKKLSGLSPHGKTIEITNNPKCHIKFAIN